MSEIRSLFEALGVLSFIVAIGVMLAVMFQ
jgi:hypothetical protein